MKKSLLIALDADGVLLNYNLAWGKLWEAAHGKELKCVEPRAYHATTYWGVDLPDKDHVFWKLFDATGWRNMPAMRGAVVACKRLAAAGHRLVCVSSMPPQHQQTRLDNLQDLGFPIHEVIATGSGVAGSNPKLEAILQLEPDWFVDDELRKLKGLDQVKCVLVDPGHPDSPNSHQEDGFIQYRVPSLMAFADRLLGAMGNTPGISSPCVGICELNEDQICNGCERSVEEIAAWPEMDEHLRQNIMRRRR